MVDNETGLIVPANNAEALCATMAKLALDASMSRAMGVAARNYMAKRSFEAAFIRSWELNKQMGQSARPHPTDSFSKWAAVA